MPIVTVVPGGQSATVSPGTSLLAAILETGVALKAGCSDSECTGDCHVFVPVGKKSLSKTTREENAKLDTIVGVGSKSRLACQAKLGEEDVSVELLGFASG